MHNFPQQSVYVSRVSGCNVNGGNIVIVTSHGYNIDHGSAIRSNIYFLMKRMPNLIVMFKLVRIIWCFREIVVGIERIRKIKL
jgi:hypothetical protein